jgi:phospholipid N-methyltransferase
MREIASFTIVYLGPMWSHGGSMKNSVLKLLQHPKVIFAMQGLRDRNVASIVPTFRHVVRKTCAIVPFDRPQSIMEFGPGIGPFTQYLWENLHPDSTLTVVDRNQTFIDYLRRKFSGAEGGGRPRVNIIHGDVFEVLAQSSSAFRELDCVFSGIPLSYLTQERRLHLFEATRDSLKIGGHFIAYQVTKLVAPEMNMVFGNVNTTVHALNIPPVFVMRSMRTAIGTTKLKS